MVVFLLVLVLLVVVLGVVASPWRWSVGPAPTEADGRLRELAAELEDLEAARDAKYREIRDAELDVQTGKMSSADFTAVDAGLRAEAVDILKRLDRVQKRLEKLRAGESAAPVAESEERATEPAERDAPNELPSPSA